MSVTARNLAAMRAARKRHKYRFGEATIDGYGLGFGRIMTRVGEHPEAEEYLARILSGEEADPMVLMRQAPALMLDLGVDAIVDPRDTVTDEDGQVLTYEEVTALVREDICNLVPGDLIDFYTDMFTASAPEGLDGIKKKLPAWLQKVRARIEAEEAAAPAGTADSPASE